MTRSRMAVSTMVSHGGSDGKRVGSRNFFWKPKASKMCIVNLTGETADVVVPEADLTDAKTGSD